MPILPRGAPRCRSYWCTTRVSRSTSSLSCARATSSIRPSRPLPARCSAARLRTPTRAAHPDRRPPTCCLAADHPSRVVWRAARRPQAEELHPPRVARIASFTHVVVSHRRTAAGSAAPAARVHVLLCVVNYMVNYSHEKRSSHRTHIHARTAPRLALGGGARASVT